MSISNSETQSHIKKRIIIFGGVFDPVHNGHLSVAIATLREFEAEKAIFLPERVPYRKQHCSLYAHRLKMLQLATRDNTALTVLDCPDDRQSIMTTFMWLNGLYPGHSFIWLVGSDAASMLSTWPDSNQLRSLNVEKIVVAIRDAKLNTDELLTLASGIDVPTHTLLAPDSAISSSQVRADTAASERMLPEVVYQYIIMNNLYK